MEEEIRATVTLSNPIRHKPLGVFFQDAAVLNHKQVGGAGARGG
jgi:hypothetical protein